MTYVPAPENPWLATVKSEWADKIKTARQSSKKAERSAATKAVKEELVAKYFPAVRKHQVIAVAPVTSGRRGPVEVLAAAAPAWVPTFRSGGLRRAHLEQAIP